MEFEWDSAKAESNLAKHGVDFAAARKVFEDPAVLVASDGRYDEPRFQALGLVNGRVLLVGFTMRGQACRIITARRANRREQRAYRPL